MAASGVGTHPKGWDRVVGELRTRFEESTPASGAGGSSKDTVSEIFNRARDEADSLPSYSELMSRLREHTARRTAGGVDGTSYAHLLEGLKRLPPSRGLPPEMQAIKEKAARSRAVVAAFNALSDEAPEKACFLKFTTEYAHEVMDSIKGSSDPRFFLPRELAHDRFAGVAPKSGFSSLYEYKGNIRLFVRAFMARNYRESIPDQIKALEAECQDILLKHFDARPEFILSKMFVDNVKRYFVRENVLFLRERIGADMGSMTLETALSQYEADFQALADYSVVNYHGYDEHIDFWQDFMENTAESTRKGLRDAPMTRGEYLEQMRTLSTPKGAREAQNIYNFFEISREMKPFLETTFYTTVDQLSTLHKGLNRKNLLINTLRKFMESADSEAVERLKTTFFGGKAAIEGIGDVLKRYQFLKEQEASLSPSSDFDHVRANYSYSLENSKIDLQFAYLLLDEGDKLLFESTSPDAPIFGTG